MILRSRVSALSMPIVYQDSVNGSDSNDGTAPYSITNPPGVGPLLTLQCALDYASKNFDLAPPLGWDGTYGGNAFGSRPGVTVQMAPNASTPALLPNPAFLDGLGGSGPITLRGDPANPSAYCIVAQNSYQGLTAQDGGVLNCQGFHIWGDPPTGANCTLINGLRGGAISIDSVIFGGGAKGGAVGAAGKSHVSIIGPVTLAGSSGFNSVFEAIEKSVITFSNSMTVTINSPMNFGGGLFVLSGAEITAEGNPPSWVGSGVSGCTGPKYYALRGSWFSISSASITPGVGGYCDSTSMVQP